jgi:ADP-ribosylglycohydrolase
MPVRCSIGKAVFETASGRDYNSEEATTCTEEIMHKKAWEMERELRDNAVPVDRREADSDWFEADFEPPQGDALVDLFWYTPVPGSRAPEIAYVEMVQAKGNLGFDVSRAEKLLPEGLALHKAGRVNELRALTAELMAALVEAPVDPDSPYHRFEHPLDWESLQAAQGAGTESDPLPVDQGSLPERIYQGWLGQLAGGSFGTAIEGYTGEQIAAVYGQVRDYITEPETVNDDVVYELVFLDVLDRKGREMTSRDIALEWVRQIPFGWSAEWVALRNLNLGLMPPQSGAWQNPYHDWIGGQMRGMVCGMLAPGWPMEAARLAHLDGIVSHAQNGVYGEVFAAVLTALAFVDQDPRALVRAARPYLPQGSQYAAVVMGVLETLEGHTSPEAAWDALAPRFEQYNWIHAYPNIAADLLALWFGGGDFTESMALLALAGNDVDCNAGLVGTVLGVMRDVPRQWSEPLGDTLETYLKGKERLSIRRLARETARLSGFILG